MDGQATQGKTRRGKIDRVRIIFACDLPQCDDCEETWCPLHAMHFADCPCVGPDDAEERGFRLVEEGGALYGIKP